MEKCSCCVSRRENELQQRNESNLYVYDLIELPVKTQRKGVKIFVCPSCDGNILKLGKNNAQ